MFKRQGPMTASNGSPLFHGFQIVCKKGEISKKKVKVQYMIGRDELYHSERLSTYPEATGDNVAEDQSFQRASATLQISLLIASG